MALMVALFLLRDQDTWSLDGRRQAARTSTGGTPAPGGPTTPESETTPAGEQTPGSGGSPGAGPGA